MRDVFLLQWRNVYRTFLITVSGELKVKFIKKNIKQLFFYIQKASSDNQNNKSIVKLNVLRIMYR